MKKMIAVMLVAAMGVGLVGTTQPALAEHHHGRGWLAAGAALLGLVVLDRLLEPPTTVVCQQPPVVYTPPPVVYTPPVVYQPVVIPPPFYRPPVFHILPVGHPWYRGGHHPGDWRGGHRR